MPSPPRLPAGCLLAAVRLMPLRHAPRHAHAHVRTHRYTHVTTPSAPHSPPPPRYHHRRVTCRISPYPLPLPSVPPPQRHVTPPSPIFRRQLRRSFIAARSTAVRFPSACSASIVLSATHSTAARRLLHRRQFHRRDVSPLPISPPTVLPPPVSPPTVSPPTVSGRPLPFHRRPFLLRRQFHRSPFHLLPWAWATRGTCGGPSEQQALRVASAWGSACRGGDRPSDPHVSRPLSGRPAVRGAARWPTPRLFSPHAQPPPDAAPNRAHLDTVRPLGR